MTSTPLQRLWLTCLGYSVPSDASDQAVRELFNDSEDTRKGPIPPLPEQLELGMRIGLAVDPLDRLDCYDYAVKLYELMRLRAWVYSVFRELRRVRTSQYHELGLPDATALAIARSLIEHGVLEDIKFEHPPIDVREGDLFYEVGQIDRRYTRYKRVISQLPDAKEPPTASVKQLHRGHSPMPGDPWADRPFDAAAERRARKAASRRRWHEREAAEYAAYNRKVLWVAGVVLVVLSLLVIYGKLVEVSRP